jgi:hypothetical protein
LRNCGADVRRAIYTPPPGKPGSRGGATDHFPIRIASRRHP